jgi:hypothetical protein
MPSPRACAMKTCFVAGCKSVVVALDMCTAHYQRWQKYGHPEVRLNTKWDGNCTECGNPDPCATSKLCKSCMRDKSAAYRKEHLDQIRKLDREGAQRRLQQRRLAVIEHYGNKCACCGVSNIVFLTIDHIGGGGNAQRRELSYDGKSCSTMRMYTWIQQHHYPTTFRVLCHNCNYAEAHGGCPHKRKHVDAA